ncbi:MAG TPA: YcxB family protein [Terriglobales bacterium]
MQITYALRQRDFYESLIAIRNRKKWVKWGFRIIFSLLVCLTALAVIRSPRAQLSNLPPLFFVVLLWGYLLWGSPWWLARTQFLKQPSAQGNRTASFDSDGVKWQWDGGSSVVEWKTYIHWMESRNEILLCSSPVQCGVVPKRALNPEKLSNLRMLLTQKVGTGLQV